MNIRFFRYCVWAIVLSVLYSQYVYAQFENAVEPSVKSPAKTIPEVARRNERRNDRQQVVAIEDQSDESNKNEETQNCTERSIHDFPADLLTYEERRNGGIVLYAFFGIYCFILTAYVCNDYLLPSLDCICASMNISADVAGATFLATASCFPELFVNVVGTFLTESDLGVGTVLGGAVFNTFATPACGALSALYGIQLEWRILSRDCLIYVISVSTLAIVMWDGSIVWIEAVILMILLAGYLTVLFCSKTITRWYCKISDLLCGRESSVLHTEKVSKSEGNSSAMPCGSYRPYFHNELIAEYRKSLPNAGFRGLSDSRNELSTAEKALESSESSAYEEPDTPFDWPKKQSVGAIAWFLFTWPLKFLLFVTIPDSRYKRFKNWYPMTFFMCVIWIAISSYLVSWMMTVIGDVLDIPDSVMGITFLSAGGNMPELVSIVILSKQGNGDMAMSNTLGANTLDILLCLGLPWMIKILMTGKDVEIVSGALSYSVLSILPCVLIFYTVTAICKFKLNKKVGAICLATYTIFLIFAILIELNVFFFVNLPMCKV